MYCWAVTAVCFNFNASGNMTLFLYFGANGANVTIKPVKQMSVSSPLYNY